MADTPADALAKRVNEAAPDTAKPGEKKEEKKPISTLESVVNETTHLLGNTVKLGLAGIVPYSFASLVPSMARDTAILTGAQIASDYTTSYRKGKKYTAGNILESAVLGTATTPVIESMFRIANSVPTNDIGGYIAKGSVWGGIMYPAFVASYQPLAYLIRNRTFKGMGKYIKENYWPALKNAWTRLLPFSLMNIFFAPSWLQIPISAGLSYLFDLFGAPQKEEVPEDQKRDKKSYLAAGANVTYKFARNTTKGLFNAVYALGTSLGDLYRKAPKPAAPTPAPSPAH